MNIYIRCIYAKHDAKLKTTNTGCTAVLGGGQLTKRDRRYEAPIKADWSEDGPCPLVR